MEQKNGGGIIYFPPENLAEYLDSSLVTPVSGGISSSRRGSHSKSSSKTGRSFFDEVQIQCQSNGIVYGARLENVICACASDVCPKPSELRDMYIHLYCVHKARIYS